MAWINVTEAMPPAGKEVKMKFVDGENEWFGDAVRELAELRMKQYDTLLWWWNESPDSKESNQDELWNDAYSMLYENDMGKLKSKYTIVKK